MNDASQVKSMCMDAGEIERSLTRIAHQILETNKGASGIALVGIVTRGDLLASQVKSMCMDAGEIERSLTRIAHQILETNKGASGIALVGIVTRGDLLAKKLALKIESIEGVKVPLGKLDISFYRDDFMTYLSPEVHSTDIPFDIAGSNRFRRLRASPL